MRKLEKQFEDIWAKAEEANKRQPGQRFFKMLDVKRKYPVMGIFDSDTKRYVLFDSINLVGNFRYNSKETPPEFVEMLEMVSA